MSNSDLECSALECSDPESHVRSSDTDSVSSDSFFSAEEYVSSSYVEDEEENFLSFNSRLNDDDYVDYDDYDDYNTISVIIERNSSYIGYLDKIGFFLYESPSGHIWHLPKYFKAEEYL